MPIVSSVDTITVQAAGKETRVAVAVHDDHGQIQVFLSDLEVVIAFIFRIRSSATPLLHQACFNLNRRFILLTVYPFLCCLSVTTVNTYVLCRPWDNGDCITGSWTPYHNRRV
jgi:hypothetical protein